MRAESPAQEVAHLGRRSFTGARTKLSHTNPQALKMAQEVLEGRKGRPHRDVGV